jgi:predicted amidohydrolase YtcJ
MRTSRSWLWLVACVPALAWLAPSLAARPAPVVTTQASPTDSATLVLRNGRIVTVDDAKPDAQALAARGDRILAVGTNEEIARYIGTGTEVIDLAGQLAVPGLIEGHGHFLGVGQAAMNLNLMKAKSWDEIVSMVAKAVQEARPGEWIVGRGWHQEKWNAPPSPAVEGFPTHASLSAVSPNNPVYLVHASGHASFANAKAMALAGVTAQTQTPAGGEILKDAAGAPIGIFRETASGLIGRAIAAERMKMSQADLEAEKRKQIALAAKESLSKGITSFQDAGSSFDEIALFRKVAEEGGLPLRLWVMVRAGVDDLARNLASHRTMDHAGHRLTMRAIKVSIDGALGSRGAWLLEPYSDLPTSTGLNTVPVEQVRAMADLALKHDLQLCVHAIGDRANRETLDVFERALASRPDGRRLRWRVEHAQHLHPADIPRFAQLGAIAAMQGIHCTSDAPYVIARLGTRRAEEGAYVWRKLMATGAVVTNGTDAPVEDVDPIASYYATVSRKLADGTRFYPDQRLSRVEALRTYTLNAAYSAFEEKTKGSLTAGKLADVTVLDKDILTIPEDEIPSARVTMTIVGGKVGYRR